MRASFILIRAWVAFLSFGASTERALALPAVGEQLPSLNLGGESGGKLDGSAWSSEMIRSKVWVLFYVDPGHRDENEELKARLKEAEFPKDKYGSIAVINMAASRAPNFIISSALKSNQEKYPEVVYVKDLDKALVKNWKLTDEAFVTVVFDKQGKILFAKDGDLDKKSAADVVNLIRSHLND